MSRHLDEPSALVEPDRGTAVLGDDDQAPDRRVLERPLPRGPDERAGDAPAPVTLERHDVLVAREVTEPHDAEVRDELVAVEGADPARPPRLDEPALRGCTTTLEDEAAVAPVLRGVAPADPCRLLPVVVARERAEPYAVRCDRGRRNRRRGEVDVDLDVPALRGPGTAVAVRLRGRVSRSTTGSTGTRSSAFATRW